jgi:hypothetical protein
MDGSDDRLDNPNIRRAPPRPTFSTKPPAQD